jgi:glycerophosphoryl diester phosphodiesterase
MDTRRLRLTPALLAAPMVAVLAATSGAQATGACGSTAFAHRGADDAQVDENTIESIERAHDLQAYTENDVFMTGDGRFVVIHNRSLAPTTDCTGYVTDRTLEDIRTNCRTTPNGQRIPSASQAFTTLAGNPGQIMNLEVKGPGWYADGNAKLVALRDAAATAGVLDRVYFSNDAGYRVLTGLRDSAPDARTAWRPTRDTETDVSPAHAASLSADVVMATQKQWTSAEMVSEFKAAGFGTWSRGSVNPVVWERLWRYGVTAELTDDPAGYLEWCDSVGPPAAE